MSTETKAPPTRTLYRADRYRVVKTTGNRYPEKDADGETIFVNKHFTTEEEAWERVMAEASAGVSLSGRSVIDAEERLLGAQKAAASSAAEYVKAKDNYEEWKRSKRRDGRDA